MPKLLRCPSCGFSRSWVVRRGHRKCKSCRIEWSPRRSSVAGDFHCSVEAWRRIINAFLLERTIGSIMRAASCSYGTGKKIAQRIRKVMTLDAPKILSGTCEADETYIGGAWSNLHTNKRRALRGTRGRGTKKQAVLGIVSRTSGQMVVRFIPNAKRRTLIPIIQECVTHGSTVYTDGHWAYRVLSTYGYSHDFVDHRSGEYVRGDVHTQTIEGRWGMIKARLKTIGGVRKERAWYFLGEQVWRYNFRHLTHDERVSRLMKLLTRIGGKN